MKTFALLAVALGAVACNKSEPAPAAPAAEPPPPKLADGAVAGVNAAVPADLKLEFEEANLKTKHLTAAAVLPKGWKESEVLPGRYQPPEGAGLGMMPSFQIGSDCNGACEPKDWAATSDKVYFNQLTSRFKVAKDEKGPGSRTVVASSDDTTYIVVARWKEGASRYFVCQATLDHQGMAAAPAFEKACEAFAPAL